MSRFPLALASVLLTSTASAMPPRYEKGEVPKYTNVKVRRITEIRSISTTAPPPAVALAGQHRLLVVLVETADSPWPKRYSNALYDRLVFGRSASSMREYYRENSYGAFDLTGEVVGPIRVPGRMDDYRYTQAGGDARGVHRLVGEAIKAAQAKVDLTAYDKHDVHGRPRKDQIVDHVMVIYAEQSGRHDGFAPIWPHRGSIQLSLDGGLKVASYTVMNHAARLGVYVHEFGHDLGLPDLYDRDYTSHGAGDWCTMASGSWAGDAERPLHFSAWAKVRLGWVQPKVVDASAQNIAVPSISQKPFALKIPIGPIDAQEYFLVENRRRVGFDAHLPAEGILIWHIDESKGDNDDERHKMVDVIEASSDQDLDSWNRLQPPKYLPDIFSGKGTSVLADDTNPSARANDGSASQIRISVLGPPEMVMHVDITRPKIFNPGGVPYTLMADGYQYGRFSTVPLPSGAEALMKLDATPGGYRAYAIEAFVSGRANSRARLSAQLYADDNGRPGRRIAKANLRTTIPASGYGWARARLGDGNKGLPIDALASVWVGVTTDGKSHPAINPFSTSKRARYRRKAGGRIESTFNFRDQGVTPVSDYIVRVGGFGYLSGTAQPEPRASDADPLVKAMRAADADADAGAFADALSAYERIKTEMTADPRRYETWYPVVVNAIGVVAYRLEQYALAIEHFEIALRRAEAARDAENAADVYENIAETAFAAKDYARAKTEATRSLAINERLDRKDRTIENLYWLGRTHAALGQDGEAKERLKAARARLAAAFPKDAHAEARWTKRIDEALTVKDAPPPEALEERTQPKKKQRRVDTDLLQFLVDDTKDAK